MVNGFCGSQFFRIGSFDTKYNSICKISMNTEFFFYEFFTFRNLPYFVSDNDWTKRNLVIYNPCVKTLHILNFSGPYLAKMRENMEQKSPNTDIIIAVNNGDTDGGIRKK